jgi:hypothetical protein
MIFLVGRKLRKILCVGWAAKPSMLLASNGRRGELSTLLNKRHYHCQQQLLYSGHRLPELFACSLTSNPHLEQQK